jgi:hypothetical protein
MAGTITTGNIPRLLQEGLKSVYGQAYDQFSTEYDKIFDTFDSRKAFEVDAQLEGFGLAAQKAEGDSIAFDSARQGFTPKYPALTYAKGFIITKEAMADELYDQFNQKARSLAFSMRQTKEIVGANVLNRGFNSAFTMTDGDGLSLFNTAHILGPSGGTQSNTLATPADLSEASLEDMLIQIGQAVDPRGLKISLQGTKLIVPVNLQFEAQRILGSVLQNDTANNATNAIRDMNAIRDGYTVNHYLTDTDAWFIKTDAPDGMKYYTRQEAQFGEDNEFNSGNMKMKADERYSFGWTDYLGMFGTEGAA